MIALDKANWQNEFIMVGRLEANQPFIFLQEYISGLKLYDQRPVP